jgi:hypothetical protein
MFTPPSGQQVLNEDPGYAFRVQEGQKALERSASAQGQLVSGGQLKAAQQYGQGLASQEYGNAWQRAFAKQGFNTELAKYANEQNYGRALKENELWFGRGLTKNQMDYERGLTGNQLWYGRAYQQNQDLFNRGLTQNQMDYERARTANETDEERRFREYQTNLATQTGLRQLRYNELANLAGMGQTSATNLGQQSANFGAQMAGNTTSAGAAQAAGRVGTANAIMGGLQGVGNAANQYLQYQMLNDYLQRRT